MNLKKRLLKPVTYDITANRCAQIADETLLSDGWGSKTITIHERKTICNFWRTLPGYTCFFDACIRLAQQLNKEV